MKHTNLSRRSFLRVTAVGAATFVLSACAQSAPTADPALANNAAPVDDEFHPTNPATVNLATGQPQLVEFFAFW